MLRRFTVCRHYFTRVAAKNATQHFRPKHLLQVKIIKLFLLRCAAADWRLQFRLDRHFWRRRGHFRRRAVGQRPAGRRRSPLATTHAQSATAAQHRYEHTAAVEGRPTLTPARSSPPRITIIFLFMIYHRTTQLL
jgi:hypothetical protein